MNAARKRHPQQILWLLCKQVQLTLFTTQGYTVPFFGNSVRQIKLHIWGKNKKMEVGEIRKKIERY